MEQLLPLAMRKTLPKEVMEAWFGTVKGLENR